MERVIRLDADSRCQLQCPLCATGEGRNRRGLIGWGYLKKVTFERIIELNPGLERIELSNWGEIFLNPELTQIIRLAYDREIELTARNGVNFNHVSDSMLATLVEHKFRHLTISIDGATQEVYSAFRKGGNLYRVLDNIRALNRLKKLHSAMLPELRWQFIAFGHNEHEIEAAQALAAGLGMKFYVKLNATADFSPVKDREAISRFLPEKASSRAVYRQLTGRGYSLPCHQLVEEPQLNWDGHVLGCCRNTTVSLGDGRKMPIEECRRGEIYQKTIRVARGFDEDPAGTPCAACGIYRTEILPQIRMMRREADVS